MPINPNQGQLGDALAALRDVHWPAPPTSFPYALWILICTLLIAGIIYLYLLWQKRRRLTLEALKELRQKYDGLMNSEANQEQQLHFAEFCKQLLKRRARTAYKTDQPELLTGAKWRDFLLRTGPGSPPPDSLTDAIYRANPELSPERMRLWVETWLKRHKYAQ